MAKKLTENDFKCPEVNHDTRVMSGVHLPTPGGKSRFHLVNDSFPLIRVKNDNPLHVEVQHALTGAWHKLKDAAYGTMEWARQKGLDPVST